MLGFGDYYWVLQNHKPDLEGRNGFWFRRIYLTVDQTLSSTLSARLRFELNQPGDFKSNLTLEPHIKDAWLKWHPSETLDVVVGIAPTPTWDSIEQFWGYRTLEKTPLDLHRLGSARDFGIALLGKFGAGQRFRYHFMAGNGSGVGTETDNGKQVALLVGFNPTSSAFLELYADHDDRPGHTDRTTVQAFAGWQRAGNRIGLQYARQNRQLSDGDDVDLDIASVFAVHSFRPDLAVVVRIDRMFDPNPDGDRIQYLPFDPTSESTLLIAGIDSRLHKRFGIIPNVEWVIYDGNRRDDIVPRITFYYSF